MLVALAANMALASPAVAADPRGAALYQQRCASCHDHPQDRIPPRQIISGLPAEAVVRSMTTGSMRIQATGLDTDSIGAIADFLREGAGGAPLDRRAEARCADAPAIDLAGPTWNGWGRDLDNSRYQPDPGLKAEDVPRLKVKWAFGYPGNLTYGQPTIVGDRLFVSSRTGKVYALNARTGCIYWSFEADAGAGVRTAISVTAVQSPARTLAFFGDEKAIAYALDATSGDLVWKTRLDDHPLARITGAPVVHEGRVFVPLASAEEGASRNAAYECCKFRGGLAALEAATGKLVWKSYTIAEEPRPSRTNAAGTQMYGPAGGSIWSAPTIDRKRGLIYVGTGNSYTDVATSTTDAVLAFALETGALKWAKQATPNDNFIVSCGVPAGAGISGQGNCPKSVGPDFDFGASPILRRLPDGREILLAGQKSGVVYGLDPDRDGATLWRAQVGAGGVLGGVEWGPAADENAVYAAASDIAWGGFGHAGGLTALSIATGERLWYQPAPSPVCSWGTQRCSAAQSAAVTTIPGAVFSGSLDGHLRAYASRDGAIVWDFDTAQAFDTVNGVQAHGGSLDTGGATIAGGTLYVNSGYGRFMGQGGNVLLALTVDGK